MKRTVWFSILLLAAAFCRCQEPPVRTPPEGKLYHGVYPGGITGYEDDITLAGVATYEKLAGKHVAWVYFSDNWFHGHAFPLAKAKWIRGHGSIPFIRLMLRSTADEYVPERLYSLARILKGTYDAALKAWARQARRFGAPLLVEWGTECNGDWFSWNGYWNGGSSTGSFGDKTKPAGPQRFVAAYRHIVAVMRAAGADNIAWVWHVNYDDEPAEPWNALENYYPGDDVVDWIGISAYGPQSPLDTDLESFREEMDSCYGRVAALAPTKPVIVAEFGCTARNPLVEPQDWAAAALGDILGRRYPSLIGFSWWNEQWENDDNPAHNTTMRLQDVPALADVFANMLQNNQDVLVQEYDDNP